MTTPKPDLDLRLAVAKTMPEKWPSACIVNGAIFSNNPDEHVYKYDLSFDAILPLVRELSDGEMSKFVDALDFGIVTPRGAINWMCRRATPTDYCRAYLAAKEER